GCTLTCPSMYMPLAVRAWRKAYMLSAKSVVSNSSSMACENQLAVQMLAIAGMSRTTSASAGPLGGAYVRAPASLDVFMSGPHDQRARNAPHADPPPVLIGTIVWFIAYDVRPFCQRK